MPAPPPIPAEYAVAKEHAAKHRLELEASERCACFFCFRQFPTSTIKQWVDANQTALCPHCGIDAVIGSAHTNLADRFLRKMHGHYFAYRSK